MSPIYQYSMRLAKVGRSDLRGGLSNMMATELIPPGKLYILETFSLRDGREKKFKNYILDFINKIVLFFQKHTKYYH